MADKLEDDILQNRDDGHDDGVDDEVREGIFRSCSSNIT